MKNIEDADMTRTAEMLQASMDAQGLSTNDVAMKADTSYEHIRGILRGKFIPSKNFVPVLAKALKIDLYELERTAVADRIRKKFGEIPLELSGKNPELEPIERVWSKLSEEHKADVIAMVKTYAKRDAKE